MKQKIFYLHGFGSEYKPDSDKVNALRKIGYVTGSDIDYTQPACKVLDKLCDVLNEMRIDLLVGTSMGGWTAAVLSQMTGIPCVLINPATHPHLSLQRHIGDGTDYTGRAFTLAKEVVTGYFAMPKPLNGIVLLDEGDELFDYQATQQYVKSYMPVHCFTNGSHRFEHMLEALPAIQAHMQKHGRRNTQPSLEGMEHDRPSK